MIALILAAGYGTRLYPLTRETPKALLPVRGKPILGFLVEKLQEIAPPLKKIALVSNHPHFLKLKDWFSALNLTLPWEVVDDGSTCDENRLGSMGDLSFGIRELSIDDDLLVLGSDNLLADPLSDFLNFARRKTPAVSLGAYELENSALACRYGVLTVNGDGRILTMEEKPKVPASRLISTAVYFFPRTKLPLVLEYVGSRKSADTLGSFIHWFIDQGEIFAYKFRGPWFDIGDIHSYHQVEELFVP